MQTILQAWIAGYLTVSSHGTHTKRHDAVIDALVPPAMITKVPMPSVSTKQMLSVVDAVMCPICLDMLQQPIELPCHAYVCDWCLKEWICVTLRLKCPCCYSVTSLQPAELKQPPELIIWLLGDIMVHCKFCGAEVAARAYNTHHCSLHNKSEVMVASQVVYEILQSSSTCTIHSLYDSCAMSQWSIEQLGKSNSTMRMSLY